MFGSFEKKSVKMCRKSCFSGNSSARRAVIRRSGIIYCIYKVSTDVLWQMLPCMCRPFLYSSEQWHGVKVRVDINTVKKCPLQPCSGSFVPTRQCGFMQERSIKADLHGTTLSHAIFFTTSLRHESFRVSQTYNFLTIVVCDAKNVVGF